LALAALVRLVPGQLTGGRLATLWQLLTLRSSLREPGSLAYLNDGFALHAPSPLWLLAGLLLVAGAVVSGRLGPAAGRALLLGGAAGFGLLAAGSLLDGVAYFRQFDVVAAASGSVNHHF